MAQRGGICGLIAGFRFGPSANEGSLKTHMARAFAAVGSSHIVRAGLLLREPEAIAGARAVYP